MLDMVRLLAAVVDYALLPGGGANISVEYSKILATRYSNTVIIMRHSK